MRPGPYFFKTSGKHHTLVYNLVTTHAPPKNIMMTILERLMENYSAETNVGIWAELNDDGKLANDAPSRLGQLCYDHGGFDDGFAYICTLDSASTFVDSWSDGDDDFRLEAVEQFIAEWDPNAE